MKHASALMDYEAKQATNYEVGRRILNLQQDTTNKKEKSNVANPDTHVEINM